MKMTQCEFKHGTTSQVAFVDAKWNLHEGMTVQFVDDSRKWTVIWVSKNIVSVADIKHTWLVGGNTEITARKA